MLDPAEWHPGVGAHIRIDETHPGFELLSSNPFAAIEILGDHAGAKPELRLVGDADGIGFVLCLDDGCHGTEYLLLIYRHSGTHIRHHGWRVPGSPKFGDFSAREEVRSLRDALFHLGMDAVAGRYAVHGTKLRPRIAGITDRVRLHPLDESSLECLPNLQHHDKTLASDTALTAVNHPSRSANLRRPLDVGVGEDQIRVGTSELEHRLFESRTGRFGNLAPGVHTACERDRCDASILDQSPHVAAWNKYRAKQVLWKAGIMKNALNCESTTRDVACVLEHSRVAGHEGGCSKSEHLPEGKIPRHDSKDDTQWIKGYERLRTADVDLPSCQKAFPILCEVVTVKGRLGDLRSSFRERLTHFRRHQLDEFIRPAAEQLRRPPHQACPFGE